MGSSGSGRGGRFAVLTEQNLQPRVQVSPIRKLFNVMFQSTNTI